MSVRLCVTYMYVRARAQAFPTGLPSTSGFVILHCLSFFTARRYISAVYAVVACPSVGLSQAGVVSKRLDKSSWFLALRLLSTHLTLCYKEMWVSPKIRVLPSGILSRTQYFKNFATASRSRCQQNSLSSSTVELVDDTYTTVDESWLFTTSRSSVTL